MIKSFESFEQSLNIILNEEYPDDYKSAVAIVQNGKTWLLGLAKNTNDDRDNKWVHPGGGIKTGESPKKAAEREAWEETGVKVKAVGEAFAIPTHKNVAFVHCKTTLSNPQLNNNEEFSALGFFELDELKSLDLYKNAKKLIDRVR